jgi:hypothetical protein
VLKKYGICIVVILSPLS